MLLFVQNSQESAPAPEQAALIGTLSRAPYLFGIIKKQREMSQMGHVQGALQTLPQGAWLARSWLEVYGCQQIIAVILAEVQIPQTSDIFLWLLPWESLLSTCHYEYSHSVDHSPQTQPGRVCGCHCGDLAALEAINSP